MEKTTPLMRQYNNIKRNYQDSILLFRMGDFYETFYDDAKTIGIFLIRINSSISIKSEIAEDIIFLSLR